MTDTAFQADSAGLQLALDLLIGRRRDDGHDALELPRELPAAGIGEHEVLHFLAPLILDRAADLGASTAFAHMDPPTPWISWALMLWTASRNQNLLHPDTAPQARQIERRVIEWLAPVFGMEGGHMTPGSTVANLTALWAAREIHRVRTIVASAASHVSVKKAADILAVNYVEIETDRCGGISQSALPADLTDACLVLTAGTTSTGAIDDLTIETNAAWTHVDAAWAGPLRLSDRHSHLLEGVERANSVAISAHKWLFQPKESALVLFKDEAAAHDAVSYGGAYLAVPNIGLLGSHGAMAAPLLATILAFGTCGIAEWIDHAMRSAETLAAAISADKRLELYSRPKTGVVNWRPRDTRLFNLVFSRLPIGSTSQTSINGERWYRNVAANPNIDADLLVESVKRAVQ